MSKRSKLALLFVGNGVLLAAVLYGILHQRRTVHPEVPQQRQKINRFLSVIKREDLDQSIEGLLQDSQQYFAPGFYSARKFAQTNLERMLSTRRSIKVFECLNRLEAPKRQSKCEEIFARALRVHTNAFWLVLDRVEDSSQPENTNSTMATELTLCAAMFAAADLGYRTLLAGQLLRLDSFQDELASRLASMSKEHPSETAPLLPWCRSESSPDIRFQVNVLRLVALRTWGEGSQVVAAVDEECQLAAMTRSEIPLVAWDAQTTWFERLVGSPIDTSKGVKRYLFYDWSVSDLLNEGKQLRVLANVRKLVLE